MIERGEQARFALEARAPVRIVGEQGRQQLDGDVASEAGIAGAVHLAHAAGAERPGDLEVAQPHARAPVAQPLSTSRNLASARGPEIRLHVRARPAAIRLHAAETRRPHTPARETRSTRSRTLDGLVEQAADALPPAS